MLSHFGPNGFVLFSSASFHWEERKNTQEGCREGREISSVGMGGPGVLSEASGVQFSTPGRCLVSGGGWGKNAMFCPDREVPPPGFQTHSSEMGETPPFEPLTGVLASFLLKRSL